MRIHDFDLHVGRQGDAFIQGDLEQIDLDVVSGRSDPQSFTTPQLQTTLESCARSRCNTESGEDAVDAWRRSLKNVLVACARRNHSPGYCQVCLVYCARDVMRGGCRV